ncbi:MAG: hypothetical protein Tsb0019_07310 [Roseibium sp.]
MSGLLSWVQSGWIAFAAIGFLWAEFALLCFLSTAPGLRFKLLLANMLAGSCLMAALGFALRGEALAWVLLYLTLALVAHIWDLVTRLRPQPAVLRRRTEKLRAPAAVTQRR